MLTYPCISGRNSIWWWLMLDLGTEITGWEGKKVERDLCYFYKMGDQQMICYRVRLWDWILRRGWDKWKWPLVCLLPLLACRVDGIYTRREKMYAKCKCCLLIRHFKIIKWYLEEFLYTILYWQIAINAFYWSFQNESYLNDFNIDLCNSKFPFLSCQSVIGWLYY